MACLVSRSGRQLQRYNEGCRQVVGCIPYRCKKINRSHPTYGSVVEDLQVLLVSSQKNGALFFPKGGWEIDESMEEAALRESREEAGLEGTVEPVLGNWRFKSRSQDKFHVGYMFPLRVTAQLDVWPEKDVRQRIWVTVNEARSICGHLWMKEALEVFVERFHQEQQKEAANLKPPCGLEFLTEEHRGCFNVVQDGEEGIDCCVVS
ncbi:NAD(+) diphosphatase [Bertholletia excelsa]